MSQCSNFGAEVQLMESDETICGFILVRWYWLQCLSRFIDGQWVPVSQGCPELIPARETSKEETPIISTVDGCSFEKGVRGTTAKSQISSNTIKAFARGGSEITHGHRQMLTAGTHLQLSCLVQSSLMRLHKLVHG
jgi:hypothetical protein